MKNSVMHIGFNDKDTNVAFNEFYIESKRAGRNAKFMSIDPTPDFTSSDNNILKFISAAIKVKDQAQVFHFHLIQVSWLFILIYRLIGVKKAVIVTIHTSYDNLNSFSKQCFLFLNLALGVEIVFCSNASKLSFKQSLMWKYLKRREVVLNGFNIKINETWEKRPKSLLIVSRFIDLKRPFFAATTFNKVTNSEATLSWVGTGKLEACVKKGFFHDKRIRFMGSLSREDTQRVMAKSSILISTSLIEGMPISVLEAAGHGCLLILSDIAPHREIAKHIPNTFLFNDEKNLLRQINFVFSLSQGVLNEKYLENRSASLKKFNMTSVFGQYDKIYQNKIHTLGQN